MAHYCYRLFSFHRDEKCNRESREKISALLYKLACPVPTCPVPNGSGDGTGDKLIYPKAMNTKRNTRVIKNRMSITIFNIFLCFFAFSPQFSS